MRYLMLLALCLAGCVGPAVVIPGMFVLHVAVGAATEDVETPTWQLDWPNLPPRYEHPYVVTDFLGTHGHHDSMDVGK